MATKVSMKDLPADTEYEPGFQFHHCITDETTGTTQGTSSRSHFPPGSKSRPHYYTNADMAFYCISGKTIFYVGKERKEYVVEAGDFFYVPRGEIHSNVNPSSTETTEGVVAYFGCSHPLKAGKVIIK